MMRAASPCASKTVGCEPAGISATTRRLRGEAAAAFTTSAARMANPSIEELSKRADHSPRQYPEQAHGQHIWPVAKFTCYRAKVERMRSRASSTLSKDIFPHSGEIIPHRTLCNLQFQGEWVFGEQSILVLCAVLPPHSADFDACEHAAELREVANSTTSFRSATLRLKFTETSAMFTPSFCSNVEMSPIRPWRS